MPVLFILVWSSGYLVGTIGAHSGPPLALLAWRFLFSFVILGLVALVTRAPWPREPRVYAHLLVIGVLIQTVQLGGTYLGLGQGVPAGLSALILCACPLVVAAAAVPLFRERLVGRQWIGLGVGLAGVVISLGDGIGGTANAAGYVFTGIALAGFAAGTLYQKGFGQSVDLRSGITIQLFGAVVTSFPLAALHGGLDLPLTWPSVGSLLWLSTINSIGGFSLLYLLLRKYSAGQTTSLLYLVPPVTALLAIPLLHQRLTLSVLVGMAVSAIGVILARNRPDRRRSGDDRAKSPTAIGSRPGPVRRPAGPT
ncbi:DMT family transporter [Actinocrispum wychmicini]|uniref:Drug/metabolite transporter (DMT)-like permease n=1 Tax=Actinocrispum wychmicini TaxID=1213861 RepID=A0A4R2K6R2_9PSEU|nr:EamA family transporter [Actinocrispum wychmicini]TCO65619.1 drug/metabolite transporter (DMT)-like permease [Actinocrispum wychmicini]